MNKKLLLGALALILSSGVLSAQEVLRIITWKGYIPAELKDKFEKETGIKLKITYSNNEEMIAKLRATRGGGFDLAQPSQDRISFVQKKFPIYQPIDYSKVNTKQLVPSMLEAVKKNTEVDGKSYAVPMCYGTTGLIVNKKEVEGKPDWSDLWNPKYAGKISYRLKRPILIGAAFGMGENPFALYNDKEAYQKLIDKVTAKLIENKKLVKNYWTSADTQKANMKNGVVIESGWDGIGWQLHKEDPNIDFVAPKSGALGWIDTYAIPKKSKNVEGAYKFINFMMKPENAAVFTNKEGYGTASLGSEKYLKQEIKDNFARSFSKADLDNIKWHPPVPEGFEEIEAKALEKIKAAQ